MQIPIIDSRIVIERPIGILRESGERGMSVNLQVEAFIAVSGGRVLSSLDELVAALRAA